MKRIYFNKVQLPVGFLDIRNGDKLKISFTVAKPSHDTKGDHINTIAEYSYDVTS